MEKIELEHDYGDTVVDTMTDFKGKVTGFVYYYNKSPESYLVESTDSTGRPISQWVEKNRLGKAEE